MKIITNDSAYVQKNDIAYLNSSDLPIPASIFMKVFGNGVTIINDSNRYDFVKFDEESESIGEERDKIATTFNSMAEEERKNHADMVTKCDLLEFKFYSLRDVLWFKQGHISMELPEGVDYPEGYAQEKSIKKLLKRKNRKNK